MSSQSIQFLGSFGFWLLHLAALDSNLVMSRDGLSLYVGGNRGSATFEDGDLMQAFWYRDEDWSNFGSSSHIAVYDAETLAEKSI